MDKYPIFSLLVSAIPCVLCNFFEVAITEREIFYCFPFLIGIYLANNSILDNVVTASKKNSTKYTCLFTLSTVLFSVLSTQIKLIANVFYAISIIFLGICLKNKKIHPVEVCLEFLGKHSMNIFLVHSFVYYYFYIPSDYLDQLNVLFRFVLVIVISLLISLILEKLKTVFTKNTSKLLNHMIRGRNTSSS